MSKHTPGPWNNFKSVIICNQDDAGLQISFVNTSCSDRRAEGRANAFLITAAPSIFSSAYSAIGVLTAIRDGSMSRNNQEAMIDEVIEELEKSIALARGES